MIKRRNITKIDNFNLSPVLAILPRRGDLNSVHALSSALYARQERVAEELQKLDGDAEIDPKLAAESAMLRVVMDYLKPAVDKDLGE